MAAPEKILICRPLADLLASSSVRNGSAISASQVGSPAQSFGAALRKSMPSWLRGAEGRSPAGSPRQSSVTTSPKAPSIPAPKAASPPRLAPEQVRTLLMGFTWC